PADCTSDRLRPRHRRRSDPGLARRPRGGLRTDVPARTGRPQPRTPVGRTLVLSPSFGLVRSPQWPDLLRLAEPAAAELPGTDQRRSGLERRRSDQIASDLMDEPSGPTDERPVRTPQFPEDAEMICAFDRDKLAGSACGHARSMKPD